MTDFSKDFVRLLKLGDESTWRKAFQPLYVVAWKTACKLGLSSDKEAQEHAFIFLKKLPYKISKWKVVTWEEIKANVIADILQDGISFINELAVGSLKRWKKMFQENAVEAREKLIILLLAIREIVAVKLNKEERRLYKDYLVLRKSPDVLSLKYGLNSGLLRDTCQKLMRKLKDGLIEFGLGWVLQKE